MLLDLVAFRDFDFVNFRSEFKNRVHGAFDLACNIGGVLDHLGDAD
ncbi:MAG TPA: hypothetical protein VGG72_13825 [Bryobacteraceae bacterium]|jgi:hypothetical protein